MEGMGCWVDCVDREALTVGTGDVEVDATGAVSVYLLAIGGFVDVSVSEDLSGVSAVRATGGIVVLDLAVGRALL